MSNLDQFFASFAKAAEATQRRLDEAHADSLSAFLPTVEPLTTLDPSLVASLAPPRQVVSEMSCEARVQMTVERGSSFGLRIQPLGSLFERRFSTSTESAVTLSFNVTPLVRSFHEPQKEGSDV